MTSQMATKLPTWYKIASDRQKKYNGEVQTLEPSGLMKTGKQKDHKTDFSKPNQ